MRSVGSFGVIKRALYSLQLCVGCGWKVRAQKLPATVRKTKELRLVIVTSLSIPRKIVPLLFGEKEGQGGEGGGERELEEEGGEECFFFFLFLVLFFFFLFSDNKEDEEEDAARAANERGVGFIFCVISPFGSVYAFEVTKRLGILLSSSSRMRARKIINATTAINVPKNNAGRRSFETISEVAVSTPLCIRTLLLSPPISPLPAPT